MPAARARACLGVQGDFVGTQLAHVTQHQPGLATAVRQGVDGCRQRAGVGVVAVVHQRCAAAQAVGGQPPGHAFHRFQSGADLRRAGTHRRRHRRRGQRVADVVAPRQRERDLDLALRRHQRET